MSSLMLRLNSSFVTFFGLRFEHIVKKLVDNVKMGVLRRSGEFGRLSISPDLISTTWPNIFPHLYFRPSPITSPMKKTS